MAERHPRVRVHYLPDCADTGPSGDTLAVGSDEYGAVNCPTCLPEMKAHGLLDTTPEYDDA